MMRLYIFSLNSNSEILKEKKRGRYEYRPLFDLHCAGFQRFVIWAFAFLLKTFLGKEDEVADKRNSKAIIIKITNTPLLLLLALNLCF